MITDTVGAFCAHGRGPLQGSRDGILAGLTFGVKDLFDVAGMPTGAGSPAWLATHDVPDRNSCCVQKLLDDGAVMAGKTHTDEHAWSLAGQNAHYGTPVNLAAPGRIPGGSSSGSAAAVAAGLVDFALGSDTGGSVRLPASFCGIYGIRTTHGRLPLDGVVPLAPSYDTAGWFARDPAVFARVGQVLLPGWSPCSIDTVLLAEDLFGRAGSEVAAALADAIRRVEAALGSARRLSVMTVATEVPWRETFRLIQSAEVWAAHGSWVQATRPAFGPGIKERFAAASCLDPMEVDAARERRNAIRAAMRALVSPGTLLLVPSVAGIAPSRNAGPEELEQFRQGALDLLCPAGHAGLPQVSLPVGTLEGCPIGLGAIGWPGGDEALLAIAQKLPAAHG